MFCLFWNVPAGSRRSKSPGQGTDPDPSKGYIREKLRLESEFNSWYEPFSHPPLSSKGLIG